MLSTDGVGKVAAVVLAAGPSVRMGRTKALLPWGDSTLAAAWVERFQRAGVETVVVVCGAERPLIEAAVEARCVGTPNPAQDGMRESLVAGLDALPADQPAFFTPVDVPPVRVETLRAMLDAYDDNGRPFAVVPAFDDHTGNPVLAGPDLIRRVFEGEPGDRVDELLAWATRRQVLLRTDDMAAFGDMDTPEQYARWAPST